MSDTLKQEVYTVDDIQKILGLSRSSSYNFVINAYRNQKPFLVLRVGTLYRVPKPGFDHWLKTGGMI